MPKGKKKHVPKTHANGQNSTPAVAGLSTVHTAHPSPINRTRTKLPTKRKQFRQEAKATLSPEDEDEINIEMHRNSTRSADRGGYKGRGGIGHASRGHSRSKGRVNHEFTMKEEAINTNSNYHTRAWMADKRSTLRHQAVVFVQAGELSNKITTSSASESENESSHSNPPKEEETGITVIERSRTVATTITVESRSHASTTHLENISNDDLFVIDDKPRPVLDITKSSVSETSRGGSNSASIAQKSSQTTISSPAVPLPPVEFLPTEENIVFTPRNQRRQQNRPTVVLTNWEVPVTIKAMTETSAPDWTKPKKKQNRRKGHKQYTHLAQQDDEEVIEPVNVDIAPIANEALQDYLENIRGQEELSEEEEDYMNKALAIEDGSAMSDLSLDDKPPRPNETRRSTTTKTPHHPRISSKLASLSPTRVSEKSEHSSDQTHDSEKDMVSAERFKKPLNHGGKSGEEDNWDTEASDAGSEVESSEDVSDAFDEQGDLLDEGDDPLWNTESDEVTPESKGKQKAIDSGGEENDDLEENEDEDEDDEDIDLDDDNTAIHNMILDDYDLDPLEKSSFQTPHLTKRSRSRQPNVPALPSADDDIAAYLQSLWKRDRESKKERKLEREKARLQGLLGSKGKTKSKGKKGKQAARREEMERVEELDGGLAVDMRKINDELRAFWEDDDAIEYALPPMHRLARKIVHTLAHAYNFGSKSHGSGNKRFTMLFKTKDTESLPVNEHKINTILKRTTWVGPTEGATRGGKKYSSADFGTSSRGIKKHRDGDIVGGDAKEIASDNRGRLMLEKLGWRSGMGLGAEGEGMKLPVFAVVKAGKSGLQ